MVRALTTRPVFRPGAAVDSGICRLQSSREPRQEVRSNALRGASIPKLRNPSPLATAREDCVSVLHDERPISSDNYVGPLLDRDRALGVLAHRQARHSERSGLLLDSAGIGNDQRRVLNETKRFQITLRWEHERASCVHRLPQPEAVDAGTRPRVQRPDQRQLAADLPENRQRFGEAVMLVEGGRAMLRYVAKTAF